MPESLQTLTFAFAAIQALWALVISLAFFILNKISVELKKNTEQTEKASTALQQLHLDVVGNYATRPDLNRLGTKVDNLQRDIVVLQTIAKIKTGEIRVELDS